MKHLHIVAFLLLIVGGLNWLLMGLFQWEIGQIFGGADAIVSRIIYVLIGLAAVYELATHKKNCKGCSSKHEGHDHGGGGGGGVPNQNPAA